MDKGSNKQQKKCFIITPIGDEQSDTFRRAKGVIESVIKPLLQELDFDDIKPSYEINVSGMINTQIINRIINDDLVIANLTENNPNVMYELCLRHVVAKPIIHICENGTLLPFDIKDNRTIFYENDMLGVEELKAKMSGFLSEISYDADYMDNPIYTAHKFGNLLKETKGTDNNQILQILVDISGKISEMNTRSDGAITNSLEDSMIRNRTYTLLQFRNEIQEIDSNKLLNIQMNESENSMQVYELAAALGTKTRVILRVATIMKANASTPVAYLKPNEIKRILKYISDAKDHF